MRSSSTPRSFLRAAAWIYFGPVVAVGVLALCVLAFGFLAMAFQLLAMWLKHAGV
jgi:hypothetical protein